MRPRDPRVCLGDVLDSCLAITSFVHDLTFEDYIEDRRTRSAVEREFIVIGEAMSRLLQEEPQLERSFTDARAIIGFRNIVVHGYADVVDETVWQTVCEGVPRLIGETRALLER